MKKIIILRGNSGSGKTTVARALQKKFGYNTMMISQDEIRRNILWVKDGVDTKALPLMIELMKYGYEHCDVVILEGIMYDEWYSPLFKTANELYGMDIYTVSPKEGCHLKNHPLPQPILSHDPDLN